MYHSHLGLSGIRLWYIHRSIDRTRKNNTGKQEYLSYIDSDGSLVFSDSMGDVLLFTSRRSASRYAPSFSGLSISSVVTVSHFRLIESKRTQG